MRASLVAGLTICVSAVLMAPASAQFVATSKASVRAGKLQTESSSIAHLNVTVKNLSGQPLTLIAVKCTALDNDEPIETESEIISNLQAEETGYGTVTFLDLHGRNDLTTSCRIPYIEID
jgi:hypothetical protein